MGKIRPHSDTRGHAGRAVYCRRIVGTCAQLRAVQRQITNERERCQVYATPAAVSHKNPIAHQLLPQPMDGLVPKWHLNTRIV